MRSEELHEKFWVMRESQNLDEIIGLDYIVL